MKKPIRVSFSRKATSDELTEEVKVYLTGYLGD